MLCPTLNRRFVPTADISSAEFHNYDIPVAAGSSGQEHAIRRGWRMAAGSLRFLLGVGTAVIGVIAAASSVAQTRACQPPQAMREGWKTSFVASCTDRNGKVAGGSQIIHLVTHKGKLYAANGYWKDARNIWYGGSDPNAGWGQVLQLSGPNEPWVVDLDLGPRHLRTELLKTARVPAQVPCDLLERHSELSPFGRNSLSKVVGAREGSYPRNTSTGRNCAATGSVLPFSQLT
jgi:hypothetical protein